MDRPERPKRKKFRVLAVDDEPDIRNSIQQLLEMSMENVEVATAKDGQSALDLLNQEEFDLILSDYRMPSMDGIEFLSRAKAEHPDVPRLMLTAYPDPALAARAAQEAGVGLFIAKPFDMDYLLDVVRSILSNHGQKAALEDAHQANP